MYKKISFSTALLLIAICVVFCYGCDLRINRPGKDALALKNWVDWNLVFTEGVDARQRDSVIRRIKEELVTIGRRREVTDKDSIENPLTFYLFNYLRQQAPGKRFVIENPVEQYCSCNDTLLWNLKADLRLDSAGGSVPNPPKPKRRTEVVGGLIEDVAYNDSISKPESGASIIDTEKYLSFIDGFSFYDRSFIAVIDTGIDSSLLDKDLWPGILPYGPAGSLNVLMGANPANFYDDNNSVKHGTSVTSIMLNAFYNSGQNKMLPRIMVLKAMDNAGSGDLFSLSCALGHAIRSKATLINLSAGFYGEENAILNHYLELGKKSNIPIIAAAGNYDGVHESGNICVDAINVGGLLSDPKRLFFPACQSGNIRAYHVLSVTGLRKPGQPCYYQNYSADFVTVGVANDRIENHCCSFVLPFFQGSIGIEGSSFATPVVSGRLGAKLFSGSPASSIGDLLNILGSAPSPGGPGVSRTYIMN